MDNSDPKPDPIDRFAGEYSWLSNFHPSPVRWDGGDWYPTAEHAYQAAKCLNSTAADIIRLAATPGEAKRLGRGVKLRPDWEEVKIGIMREIIGAKFAPGTTLAYMLIDTGERPLIEGNHWGDRYWGCTRPTSNIHSGEWVGLNWLGELLMRQREALSGK